MSRKKISAFTIFKINNDPFFIYVPLFVTVCTTVTQLKKAVKDLTGDNYCILILRTKPGVICQIDEDFDKYVLQKNILIYGSLDYVKNNVGSSVFNVNKTYFANLYSYLHIGKISDVDLNIPFIPEPLPFSLPSTPIHTPTTSPSSSTYTSPYTAAYEMG